MILALEYALRTGTLKSCIQFPISLFIEHKHWNDKIVITIHKNKDKYVIKHWLISRCDKQFLPSFSEFIIGGELFDSPHLIVKNYYILKFTPSPYLYGRKQYADYPYSLTQEQEYAGYINTFFNPQSYNTKRLNWLWEAFRDANKVAIQAYDTPYTYPYMGYSSISDLLSSQRAKIKSKSKKIWSNWEVWKKYLLFKSSIAPELFFQQEYTDKDEKEEKESLNRINRLLS